VTNFLKNLLGLGKNDKPAPKVTQDEPVSQATRPRSAELSTVPLHERALELMLDQDNWPYTAQISAGWAQSPGRQRDHNEDAIFAMTSILMSDERQIPFGLYIVADGMGGHQHGEIASGLAARAIGTHVVKKFFMPLFGASAQTPDESLQEILQNGVFEAHRTILKTVPGGGTTLTAALIVGDQVNITHVGDSRAYLFPANGAWQVLTRDHSLVKRLEELGQLTSEEAAQHPHRNVLYRALGQGEPFDPDIQTFPLPNRGYLLLCSDGLWGVIPEKEMVNIIGNTPDLHIACQKLVDAANRAGGPDNISAILCRLSN